MYNLISLGGVFGLMFIAWIFSNNKRIVNWRLIFWALVSQLLFALIIFRIPAGIVLFDWANVVVIRVLAFAREGMYFLFGPLAVSPMTTGPAGEEPIGFILAFQVLPVIIFFSSLMSLLYYLRIMPLIVRGFSWMFTRLMKVSGAESLGTASNIFVGIESVFTIKPHIEKMTLSELCTILTAGMATIASGMLAFYVGMLHGIFPGIAGHLISASLLSAPAALVMSKLIFPEVAQPQTLGVQVEVEPPQASNWVESIISGANEGVRLVVGIIALLLAFLGLLAMVNWGIGALGAGIGPLLGLDLELSLEKILGFVFYPLTFLMGVPIVDVAEVATLLGERAIVTEVVAYKHLAYLMESGALVHYRSAVIAAYALCGFAHIASLAIFVGGISALVPKRSQDLARLGFRALFAATLACLMTGAIAGVFAW
jgi:CNT family concentrative nucleoside transporter